MKQITLVVFGLMAMLISVCSFANDSLARVGTGGLELLKTDNIQMISEVLEISTSKIRVTYHFLNTSSNDIKTTVAFPMPAFNSYGAIDGQRENQRPLDSFKILVNGVPVPINENREFLINDKDAAGELRAIGLSDSQIFDPKFTCTSLLVDEGFNKQCKLTDKQINAIRKLNTSNAQLPDWQIKETAYWEQTFPAGKEVEVVHEYKPFVGRSGYTSGDPFDLVKTEGIEACLDEMAYKTITKKSPEEDFSPPVGLEQVEYGTGRNWKGPIKIFKLILRKERPSNIISLCFPGIPKKTSPSTIEFSHADFVPQDKLVVFFYSIAGK